MEDAGVGKRLRLLRICVRQTHRDVELLGTVRRAKIGGSLKDGKFTKTDPTSKGWQRGMRFGVCLAAWMPATRATDSTSPLEMLLEAMSPVVSGFISTLQRAIARR